MNLRYLNDFLETCMYATPEMKKIKHISLNSKNKLQIIPQNSSIMKYSKSSMWKEEHEQERDDGEVPSTSLLDTERLTSNLNVSDTLDADNFQEDFKCRKNKLLKLIEEIKGSTDQFSQAINEIEKSTIEG